MSACRHYAHLPVNKGLMLKLTLTNLLCATFHNLKLKFAKVNWSDQEGNGLKLTNLEGRLLGGRSI